MEHHVGCLLLDRDGRVADHDFDPIGLQVGQQRRARLRLFEAQKPRPGLDDGDFRTKPGKSLGELDPHRTATQHHEPRRQLARYRGLPVGPVLDLVQAFDRRDRRGAAVGDDDRLARHQLIASDLDRPQVDQLAGAPDELGSGRFQGRRRPPVIEVACHPEHALGDLREVDVPLDARGGQGARAKRLLEGLAGPKQRFGGHAAPVGTFAADELPLDDRERDPAALQAACDGFSGDPAAETDDIKLLRQLVLLLRRLRAAATREARWR